jgi:hypothetical protein
MMPAKEETRGRNTLYTEEMGDEICQVISESTKGLTPLCIMNPHWPNPRTIRNWILDNEEFGKKYARAKLIQADEIAEECIDISDDSSHDTLTIERDDGSIKEIANTEFIARSRLRVDTRKWYVSKLVPKVYGDNSQKIIYQQKFEDLSEEEQVNYIESLPADKKLKLFSEVAKKIKASKGS